MEMSIVGGRRVSNREAPIILKQFEKIRTKHGVLRADLVVEAARNKLSPLHHFFPWDDKKAAEAHRLEIARDLIASVRVSVKKDPDSKPFSVRALIRVSDPTLGPTFAPLMEVMESDEYRAQMLTQAMRELETFRTKYADLVEFDELFSVFVKLKRRRRRA